MSNLENKEILLAIDSIIVKHINILGNQINCRLDKIEEKIKVIPQMQRNIEQMQSDIKEIQGKIKVIPQMQRDIKEIQDKITVIPQMQSNIEQMQRDIKELQKNQKALYEEVRNISRTVAKIEVEHGEKLAILLDVVTGNIKKQEIMEKRLSKCEKRLENNESQTYFLNSKIQNL